MEHYIVNKITIIKIIDKVITPRTKGTHTHVTAPFLQYLFSYVGEVDASNTLVACIKRLT